MRAQRRRPRRHRQHPLHRHRRPPRHLPGHRRPQDGPRRRARSSAPASSTSTAARRGASGCSCTSPRSAAGPTCTTSTSKAPSASATTCPDERSTRRAAVVGTGLIGGSIGLALRRRGWHVTGDDRDPRVAARALELGALDAVGTDPEAEITFLATPVRAVADAAKEALAAARGHRHRRRQREGVDRRRGRPTPASSAATRWPAPSRRASTAPTPTSSPARCGCSRPRPTTDDRALTALRDGDRRARRRRRVAGARPPRRARGGRLARAAPHRGVAHADGRRPRHRAPGPAAPGRRRLPRHDPHRVRSPRHLARHLRREPHRHRRRARRPARLARRGARHRRRRRPRRPARRCSSRPAPPAPTCPSRVTGAGDLCEVRVPVPDRAGRARRGHHAGRHARRQHRRPRDRPLERGRAGRAHPPRRGRRRRAPPRPAWSTRATGRRSPRWSSGAAARPDAGRARSTGPLDVVVSLPGSKSITNRALVCAALADGTSTLTNALHADDTEAMVEGLRALGAEIDARLGRRSR